MTSSRSKILELVGKFVVEEPKKSDFRAGVDRVPLTSDKQHPQGLVSLVGSCWWL
jgi:hypothetical protein